MTDLFPAPHLPLFSQPPDSAVESPPGRPGDVAIQTWAAIGDRDNIIIPLWQILDVGWFQSDDHGRWLYLARPIPYSAFPIGVFTFKPHDLHPVGLNVPILDAEQIRLLLGEAPNPKVPRPYHVRPREADAAKAIKAAGFDWDGWNRTNFEGRLQEAMTILFADRPANDWPEWPTHHDALAPNLSGAGEGPVRKKPQRPKKTTAELVAEASAFASGDAKLDNLF